MLGAYICTTCPPFNFFFRCSIRRNKFIEADLAFFAYFCRVDDSSSRRVQVCIGRYTHMHSSAILKESLRFSHRASAGSASGRINFKSRGQFYGPEFRSTVKIYSATSSLVCFENNFFSTWKKRSSLLQCRF
jgi:hypothetical protein